jgi:hypothetical protein
LARDLHLGQFLDRGQHQQSMLVGTLTNQFYVSQYLSKASRSCHNHTNSGSMTLKQ